MHPGNEYSGPCDPTRELPSLWTQEEMTRRVETLFSGDVEITNEGCPPAYSLKRPADEVSLLSLSDSCLRVAFDSTGTDQALSKAFSSNPPLLDRKRKGKESSDEPKGKRPHGPNPVSVGGPRVGSSVPAPPRATAAPTTESGPLRAPLPEPTPQPARAPPPQPTGLTARVPEAMVRSGILGESPPTGHWGPSGRRLKPLRRSNR